MRLVDPNSRWAEQCLNEYEAPRVLLDHERGTPEDERRGALVAFVLTQLLWIVPVLFCLPALVR